MNSYFYHATTSTMTVVKPRTTAEKQKELIEATTNWIISEVSSNLKLSIYDEKLEKFRNEILKLLEQKFRVHDCANLRTTRPNTDFILLAEKCGIPQEALPQGTSIVINNSLAYFTTVHSPSQKVIKSFL